MLLMHYHSTGHVSELYKARDPACSTIQLDLLEAGAAAEELLDLLLRDLQNANSAEHEQWRHQKHRPKHQALLTAVPRAPEEMKEAIYVAAPHSATQFYAK